MKMTRFAFAFPRPVARDNEGGDASGSPEPGSGEPAAPEAGDTNPATGKVFTQEQVDQIVVKRNKKVREQLEQTERRYEQLLQSQNLSSQEREGLSQELESLQAQLRTREQQAAYDAKKAQEKYNAQLESTSSERDYYKDQFESSTRNNAIMSAALEHDAYNPEQFISVLGPRTKIVEEVDGNGEKTGRLVPRVEVQVTGEDGSTSVELRPVSDAVAQMKDEPEKYGNLFRSNVASGIGEGSSPSANGRGLDATKVSDEEYFKNRDAYKQRYGIRDRRGF